MNGRMLAVALLVAAAHLPQATTQEARAQEAAGALITADARKAIDAGLGYLAKEQAADGSWGAEALKGNAGISSLCGLAFLSAGERVGRGKHGDVLAKAVDFVLSQESAKRPGYFGDATVVHGPMYVHGYATLFLAEVLPALPDAAQTAKVKTALTRAVKVILDAQNEQGGWRYQPLPRDADVTVSSCQLHALAAARAAGIAIPKDALEKGAAYVMLCRDTQGSGGFCYQHVRGPIGFARTAAALSALQQCGAKDAATMDQAIAYLRAKKPAADNLAPGVQHYYYGYYYATQGFAGADAKEWRAWYIAMRDELLGKGGHRQADHSWSNGQISPHYSTAMALLILQTPDSKLPSMKR